MRSAAALVPTAESPGVALANRSPAGPSWLRRAAAAGLRSRDRGVTSTIACTTNSTRRHVVPTAPHLLQAERAAVSACRCSQSSLSSAGHHPAPLGYQQPEGNPAAAPATTRERRHAFLRADRSARARRSWRTRNRVDVGRHLKASPRGDTEIYRTFDVALKSGPAEDIRRRSLGTG